MQRAIASLFVIAVYFFTPALAAEADNHTATPAPSASAEQPMETSAPSTDKNEGAQNAETITLLLKADLSLQRLTVVEKGVVIHEWPISSGLRDYPTPTGTFQPTSANKMWYSRQYDWTPMPYAVFFTKGVAFHGTNATWRLGKSASHGCVRLATPDAETLFALVHKHGFPQTQILVFGTPKHDPQTIAKSRLPDQPRIPNARSRPDTRFAELGRSSVQSIVNAVALLISPGKLVTI